MHVIERHQYAVTHANQRTYLKYRMHGPYTPNTEAHDYWIKCYDGYIATH